MGYILYSYKWNRYGGEANLQEFEVKFYDKADGSKPAKDFIKDPTVRNRAS